MNSRHIAELLAAGAIVLGAAACSSHATATAPSATTPAAAPATTSAAAPSVTDPAGNTCATLDAAGYCPGNDPAPAATAASDAQVCNDVNTWERNNDGQAASSFGADTASQAIVTEASGSSAVDTDVTSLSADSGSSAATDLSSLASDCAAAGVTLTGSDFSGAAAASTPPTAPAMSAAEQQAVAAAQGYLNLGSGFSAESLLNQLTSSSGDGFSHSDAAFAINYLKPDWNAQAVEAAQGYLKLGSGFSAESLLNQLTSSSGGGFSQSEAAFAINYLKPDWNAQAVEAAQGYLKLGTGFSRSSLIQQLTSSSGDGFTEAQAEYAASKVGL